MQKGNLKLIAVTAIVLIVVLLASWQLYGDESDRMSLPVPERFAASMADGDYSDCYDLMSDEMKAIYEPLGGEEAFADQVTSIIAEFELQYGPMSGIGEPEDVPGGFVGTPFHLQYSAVMICVHTDADGLVDGYYFVNHDLPSDDPVPEGIVEEDVSFGAEGMSKLPGKLSYAEGSDHSVVAVLVSGSGPHGMNSAIGHNQIFQQLAWGLNEKGVDVLRYDKRTYADPITSAALGAALDINYEYIYDAVAAAQLLNSMGYDSIYVVGHSLGAMVAPAVVSESGGLYDGMVSLAGSPRSLAEIQYDQNMAVIETMPDGPEKDAMMAYIDAEMEKFRSTGSMTTEELLTTQIFGSSAYYYKSMEDLDIPGTALSLEVPMLFIQGTSDWQVSPERDYGAWMEILSGKENVQSELMVGLNHIMCIPGEYQGTVMEYYQPQTVNQSVIDRVADFILSA